MGGGEQGWRKSPTQTSRGLSQLQEIFQRLVFNVFQNLLP